jgi:DNA-binding NtrC family response regulator
MTRPILVVDDNHDLARGVALVLSELTPRVTVAHSATSALAALAATPADLVFSDVRMPGVDGLALVNLIKERTPRTRVILFTGDGTIEDAVNAMKRGAFDYLTKPFEDEELITVARRALAELDEEDGLEQLAVQAAGPGFHGIVARDPRMLAVLAQLRRVAPAGATVLIHGESGTGKERIARALHAESPRARGPFVAFNAAAVPETIAEAELFGCRRGAFTGADRDRKGLFCEAHGGTLFIDEVSSMPLALQGKLLRVVEERVVQPLGGGPPIPVDVRIVAAANEDLARLVRDGAMRRDLYYRLSVVRVTLPPLRERREDIPLLAQRFLERHGRQLTPPALQRLVAHDWPGNVRELMNVIERAALLGADEAIGAADIVLESPLDEADDDDGEPTQLRYDEAKRQVLEGFQRRYIERLLVETGGNLSAAARRAGITRVALHRIVRRLAVAA